MYLPQLQGMLYTMSDLVVMGIVSLTLVRCDLARPSGPQHFFAEVGVVLFARALIITLLFSLGKNGIDVGVQR